MAGSQSRENGKKGGRPKGMNAIKAEEARKYIIERVTTELEPIMDKAIEQAKSGDQATRKDLFDRAYGKPVESLELTGKDGGAIEAKVLVLPERGNIK